MINKTLLVCKGISEILISSKKVPQWLFVQEMQKVALCSSREKC